MHGRPGGDRLGLFVVRVGPTTGASDRGVRDVRRIAVFTTVLLAVLLVAPPSAWASAPSITRQSVDVTQVWNDCGFDLEAHIAGDVVTRTWTDGGGTRVVETYPRLKLTLSDPRTQASLVVVISGPFHLVVRPDGSSTEMGTGKYIWGVDPRDREQQGLFSSSGRYVRSLDAQGNETAWSFVGTVVPLCPVFAT